MTEKIKRKKRPKTQLSRWSQALEDGICELVRGGLSYANAAMKLGLGSGTIYEWMSRGEGRNKRESAIEPFVGFARAVRAAEAEWIQVRLDSIREFAESGKPNSWQANAWLLERRYPEQFGQNRVRVASVEGTVGADGRVTGTKFKLTTTDYEAYEREFVALLRGQRGVEAPGGDDQSEPVDSPQADAETAALPEFAG